MQADRDEAQEQLRESTVALTASRAEAAAAVAEAAQLADQLEAADKRATAVESEMAVHVERHEGGAADMEALACQLQATQSATAAISAEAAELRSEVPLQKAPHVVRCYLGL